MKSEKWEERNKSNKGQQDKGRSNKGQSGKERSGKGQSNKEQLIKGQSGKGRSSVRRKKASGNINRNVEDNLSLIFLLYMFTVYPLVMNDMYFDITLTKYRAFSIALCCYAVLMSVVVLVEVIDRGKLSIKKNMGFLDYSFWAFLLANLLAFLMAENKLYAYTGEMGRRCGLQFVLLVAFMYLFVGHGISGRKILGAVFMLVGTLSCLIGILQFMGCDFLRLRDGLSMSIKYKYISTFGNIDIFASFLSIIIPFAMGIFIMEEALYLRTIAGIMLFCGFGALISANADLGYAGVGIAIIAALLICAKLKKMERFFQMGTISALGYLVVALCMKYVEVQPNELEGINKLTEHTGIIVLCLVVFALVACLFRITDVLCKKGTVKITFHKISGNVSLLIWGVIVLISAGVLVVCGVRSKWEIFDFNDSWGTYRGFVWSRLCKAFSDFSLPQKLFGYGNESVKDIMTSGFYDEMMDITGEIYDNAHNEYLQYLVTTGIFGALSYVALIVGALVKALKNVKSNPLFLALALGITGYAAQGFFNLNQSLTTPFLFVMIAMVAGLARWNDNQATS